MMVSKAIEPQMRICCILGYSLILRLHYHHSAQRTQYVMTDAGNNKKNHAAHASLSEQRDLILSARIKTVLTQPKSQWQSRPILAFH